MNFVLAVAYHFCLALPSEFTQPGNHPQSGIVRYFLVMLVKRNSIQNLILFAVSERRPDRGGIVLPGRRLLALGAGLRRRGGGRRRRPLPAHGLMLIMTCSLIFWNK